MIAIIPARGGSKGLPGKNILPLLGKPLIAYTIEAALKSQSISRVILSTDDPQIAAIGEEYGAEVPFMRPAELAGDDALAVDVYNYTLNRLDDSNGSRINNVVILLPTSPLRTHTDVDNAIGLFIEKNADSVISFCEEHHPITWNKHLSNDGRILPIFESRVANRQSEKKTYYPNGAVFVFKREMLEKGIYYSENTFAYLMDRTNSIDIDTQYDFQYAEFMLNIKTN
ncbi:N-acylneuraminate cytidylyltransferase [Galbibacter marinus]|uniref:N-acylneuraminate cytidylyltransferase n=1 Tax=Galbibacter marinus TaxID=555500 RepID=K2QI75_9FLAO|nr:acylneuraminate cytidylyltransferase family protein [Galbibacter marinus]EKF54432.1 N-acylneuraminate cytidylyltransferase [Galbibacter marinus]